MLLTIPLFERFPGLKEKLPYDETCSLPSPVGKLDKIGEKIGLDHLYVKRDGFISHPVGGNKLRKLAFLMGEAIHRGHKEVMTFGFAGSNHALATAVSANNIGMRTISMLLPQPNARYVRQNLLMNYEYDGEVHQCPNKLLLPIGTWYQRLRLRIQGGKTPYVIPPGGSSPLGVLGFVNAAFELKEQIEGGEIPEPARLYVPLGTGGTFVGLLIGFKALGVKTQIVPVRVVGKNFTAENKILKLFRNTVNLLLSKEPSFPRVECSPQEIKINDDFLGEGYAHFTQEGMDAVALMEETEKIKLDGTYTGKTFAALIAHARNREIKRDEVVLFWNTLNEEPFLEDVIDVDYHWLPRSFHPYFEQDVQPLDRTKNY